MINAIQTLFQEDIIKIIISNPRNKEVMYKKVTIRKVLLKEKEVYQIEKFTQKQAFHENVTKEEAKEIVLSFMQKDFKQCDAFTKEHTYMIKISKKEKVFVSKKKAQNTVKQVPVEHNRKKEYLIPENEFIAPLYDLGVISKEGKIIQSMYDKYKQINRFIEMINDCLSEDMKELNIIDFGCGKSYLTFILYYFLVEVKKIKVHMIGLDLKEEVIAKCNDIASKYHYEDLHFKVGDINGYKTDRDIDMVITLHACDTATDYALYNAITWNAKMIFSVPCCQHEINAQWSQDAYSLFSNYGLIKERTAALVTDAMRANLLQCASYKVQVLEFIDLAHSPKNILLRCVKSASISKTKKVKALQEVEEMMETFHLQPTLYTLLKNSHLQF